MDGYIKNKNVNEFLDLIQIIALLGFIGSIIWAGLIIFGVL